MRTRRRCPVVALVVALVLPRRRRPHDIHRLERNVRSVQHVAAVMLPADDPLDLRTDRHRPRRPLRPSHARSPHSQNVQLRIRTRRRQSTARGPIARTVTAACRETRPQNQWHGRQHQPRRHKINGTDDRIGDVVLSVGANSLLRERAAAELAITDNTDRVVRRSAPRATKSTVAVTQVRAGVDLR